MIERINKKNGLATILSSLDADEIEEVVQLAAESYYNDSISLISDQDYDLLLEKLRLLRPRSKVFKKIGAPAATGKKKVKLPYWMGSMDKIKTDEKAVTKWLATYHGPYLISDKLDGISCLMVIKKGAIKLYTRGDGEYGQDVTHLAEMINMSVDNVEEDMVVRGELIMQRKVFDKKYASKMANARNMVGGIVNSKPGSVNRKHAADVNFVVYEVLVPTLMPDEQMNWMEEQGLNVVYHELVDDIDLGITADLLKKRKKKSPYEIDGIIVTDNKKHRRNTSGNPPYSFAYKGMTESAQVEVIEVLWKASKDGIIVPRIHYEKVRLSQAELEYTNGFNARYIVDNGIGPGAKITIIRSGDVIPYILSVDEAVEPQMPKKKNYRWDRTEVNIVLTDPDSDQTVVIRRLTKFVTDIGVADMSEGTITKLVNGGFDTIPKIIAITPDDMLALDGFQERLANKIYDNLQASLAKLSTLDLMVASNAFGKGFGKRKIKKILDVYPKIVSQYSRGTYDTWYNKLMDLEGFSDISVENFLNAMDDYQALHKKVAKVVKIHPHVNKIDADGDWAGQIIVFTGFRNDDWKQIIENAGGKVSGSVSSKTTLVVYKDGETGNAKYRSAVEKGIKTVTQSAFARRF